MKNNTSAPYLLFCLHFGLLLFTPFLSGAQQPSKTNQYPATFLWRISGKGLDKPSYLYGTMHLTDKRLFFFGDSLYKALEKTDGFAIEVDPDEMSTQLIQSFTKKDTSGYVKDAVDKEEFERLKKILQKKYGFNADKLTKRQAYLARNEWMKEMRKEDDMYTFMDAWLYNIARQLGKWTGGIEDLDDQLRLIEKDEADFSFEELLISKKIRQGGLNQMIDIYLSQDLFSLDTLINTSIKSRKEDWLLKRNFKMVHRMDSLMKLRTVFFAVGAAHLPGDSGVIELLAKRGFTVTPVFSSRKISPDDYVIKTPVNKWVSFTSSDSLYSVTFPSKSATMAMDENVLKMEMCIDIPTATYFLTAAVPNMRKETNQDKLIDEMLKGFTKGSKIISKRKINENGQKGVDIIVEKDAFIRIKLFLKGNYAFMAITGHDAKKEMLTGEMSERFFSSFAVNENLLSAAGNMKTFTSEEDGYSVLLPQIPGNIKTETGEEGWVSKTYSAFDSKNSVYNMVIVKRTAPGYYLNGDSNYFSVLRANWESITDKVLEEKYFSLGGYPAMQYNFVVKNGKEKATSKTLTINRGNRSYMLIAIVPGDINADQEVNMFFNSFQLIDYKESNWQKVQSSDGVFSTFAPAPMQFKAKKEGDSSASVNYIAYDSITAVSYELAKVHFVDYYHAASDSAVFNDAMVTQTEPTDSVISKRYLQNGNDKAQEIILQLKDNQNLRRMRLVLHGDTMYIASAYLLPQLLKSENVNQYFDQLRILIPSVATTLFTKKTNELLTDLASGDSARFHKAAASLGEIEFSKEDLPFLKDAIMKQYDFAEDGNSNIYNSIADIIAGLKDSSVVSFVEKKYYSPNIDNEAQKLALLRLLALTRTKKSYEVLKDLLISLPPYTDYLYSLQSVMTDSLQLTKQLFPDLLKLSADTLYTGFTASLANTLLDSNYLKVNQIKQFEINFRKFAESFLLKVEKDPEDFNYDAVEVLDLIAKFNSVEGNALLQRVIQLKQSYFNNIIVPELLMNKQTVPKEIILGLAADKETRFSFYYRLKKRELLSTFPEKYATQKSLAESDVYNMASEEEQVNDIVYVGSKLAEFKGETKRFYLYKVKLGDAWYLGVSGAYEKEEKVVFIKDGNDVGGIYWQEEFNSKKADELFEKWLNGDE
ncbi:MAG: TraB/GumN family protein [Lacibacter sp.]